MSDANLNPTIDNLHVAEFNPMPTPDAVIARLPLRAQAEVTVRAGREALNDIIDGKDQRHFVVVGPCSIHDPIAGLDYARRLKALADKVSDLSLIHI